MPEITGTLTGVSPKRGRGPGHLTITDTDGEVHEIGTFDPGVVREMSQAIGSKVKATYTEKTGEDKKGEARVWQTLTNAEVVEPGPNADRTEAPGGVVVEDNGHASAPDIGSHVQKAMALPASQALMTDLEALEQGFQYAVRQRELLEGFIRLRFQEGKHYYDGKMFGSKKPVLSQEGAQLIRAATGLRIVPTIIGGPLVAPDDPNAKYTIVVDARVYNRFNELIGSAIGSASSCIWSSRVARYIGRAVDPDKTHNTTIKMSVKRAYVAAVRANTAAAEFFTEDLEEPGYMTEAATPGDADPQQPPAKAGGFIRKR